MIRFHRDVRREVERLGATNIDIHRSDPHSIMYYTFNGCRHRATLANSPSDNNAIRIKLSDIRRDLVLSTRSKTMSDERTLTDSIGHEEIVLEVEDDDAIIEVEARAPEPAPEPLRETTARGRMAHYQSNGCLDFQFPREIVDCLPPGERFRVEPAGQDWMILPGGNARLHVGKRSLNTAHITIGAGTIAPNLPFFNARPAEYLASGGHLLVHLLEPVEDLVRESSPAPKLVATPEPIPTPEQITAPYQPPIPVEQKVVTTEADLRTLLGTIRRVESETLLRLVREGDRLLWIARIE